MKPAEQSLSPSIGRAQKPQRKGDAFAFTVASAAQEGSDFDQILGFWSIIARRKTAVIGPMICGGLLALVLSLVETPLYESFGSLEIQGSPEAFLEIRNAQATNPHVQNQARLIQSRELLDRAQSKLLTDPPEPHQPKIDGLQRVAGALLPGFLERPALEKTVGQAAANLEVTVSRDHTILDVRSASSDPEVTAKFVNVLLNEYIVWNQEQRWESYRRAGEWLLAVREDLRRELAKSEERLAEYANRHGIVLTSEDPGSQESNVEALKLRQLQAELSAAQANRILKEAALGIVASGPAEYMPTIEATSPLHQYQLQLSELNREKAELRATLTPEHYRVRKVEAQIDAVKESLEREREGVLRRVQNDYGSAAEREKLLAEEYVKQTRNVSQQSEKLIQYGILKREVDINRKLYETTLEKGEEASITSALRTASARIVNHASPADFPFKPNRVLYSGLGAIAGLAIGLVLVFFQDRADLSIRGPGDATRYLETPELGAIPSAMVDRRLRRTDRRDLGDTGRRGSVLQILGGRADGHEKANGLSAPGGTPAFSLVADSYRSSLTSILLSLGDAGSASRRVIVVTSPGPQDGKTTIVSNLAIALRDMNRRVLVIDGDMRRHRLHEVFKLPNAWGLSDILAEDRPVDEYPAEILSETEIPGLSLLPSGPTPSRLGGVLHSDRLQQLLDRFRREFDIVLIDTPPMLYLPDARLFGLLADGVVVVVRAGRTSRDAAYATVRRLEDDGARVLGVILNDWKPTESGYGSYGELYTNYYGSPKS